MDAVEYLKTLDRICRTHQACDGCPILDCGKIGCGVSDSAPIELIDTVEVVEQWAKEHPEETRQTRFLKEYPNARTDWEDVLSVCPHLIDQTVECPVQKRCLEECWVCRRKYWSEEVPDDD